MMSEAVYAALAPNRFRDFWRELASSLDDFVISKVAGGATPGPSVQQWAADLIAHVGSDPVHQSFVPALRSDQPNSRCPGMARERRGEGRGQRAEVPSRVAIAKALGIGRASVYRVL
jgi:hypothetical protein